MQGILQVPIRYVPRTLSKSDQKSQINQIIKSRKAYKKGTYVTRKKMPSFKNRPSSHVVNARRLYGVESISPSSRVLSRNSGCSIKAMKQIVRKGEGAYFSSGSRPNQTAKSWGIARLAASLTGSKSAVIDYTILESGCNPKKPAIRLAKQSRKRFGTGKRHAKRRTISTK
jgi:hypothetical protein